MALSNEEKESRIRRYCGVSERAKLNLSKPKSAEFSRFITENRASLQTDPQSEDGSHKIVDVAVADDGSVIKSGVIFDEDNNIKTHYAVMIPDDESMARQEGKQFQEGKLKEVCERTLVLHEEAGYWDKMKAEIEAGNIKIVWN